MWIMIYKCYVFVNGIDNKKRRCIPYRSATEKTCAFVKIAIRWKIDNKLKTPPMAIVLYFGSFRYMYFGMCNMCTLYKLCTFTHGKLFS